MSLRAPLPLADERSVGALAGRSAKNTGQVASCIQITEARGAQQGLHALGLIVAVLDGEPASALHIAARAGDEPAYRGQTVEPALQGDRRLVAQVVLGEVRVSVGDIWWIGDDDVQRHRRYAVKPVGFDELDIRNLQPGGIAPR